MSNELRRWMTLCERAETVHPSTNNLGRPIAHSPDGEQAFWRWFGGSKVVGKGGVPLVVFHGTVSDFRAFDPAKANSNTKTGVPASTFVFTNSHDVALSYAGQKTEDWGFSTEAEQQQYHELAVTGSMDASIAFLRQHGIRNVKSFKQGANLMPCYLKILKPLKINAHGDQWHSIYHDQDDWTTNELMDHARQQGYDGLIVRNVHDRQEGSGKASDIYAVFNASQIKSAIGNSGRFFPASDAIDEANPHTTV